MKYVFEHVYQVGEVSTMKRHIVHAPPWAKWVFAFVALEIGGTMALLMIALGQEAARRFGWL